MAASSSGSRSRKAVSLVSPVGSRMVSKVLMGSLDVSYRHCRCSFAILCSIGCSCAGSIRCGIGGSVVCIHECALWVISAGVVVVIVVGVVLEHRWAAVRSMAAMTCGGSSEACLEQWYASSLRSSFFISRRICCWSSVGSIVVRVVLCSCSFRTLHCARVVRCVRMPC